MAQNFFGGTHRFDLTVPLGGGAELADATFVERPSQLVVLAELEGAVVRAHMADRGRLTELLVPGRPLLLARRNESGRKTAFQAVAAYTDDGLVSLDTHLPNRLVALALAQQALEPFAHYTEVRREVALGDSRFDFLLSEGADRCVLEVKSVGHVRAGVASFPDAPTTRGARHLDGLAALARTGERAAALFLVQGGDAQVVIPNTAIDPGFAAALARAATAGVELHAYACFLTLAGLTLGPAIPVRL
jgi:sugar fermentation stimulation protein A